jgi:hypothetical protein
VEGRWRELPIKLDSLIPGATVACLSAPPRAIDPLTGDQSDAFSWQEFERKRAGSVVYIYPSKRIVSNPPFHAQPHGSVEDLASAILTESRNASPGTSVIPHTAEHPRLAEVKRRIEKEIDNFFGSGSCLPAGRPERWTWRNPVGRCSQRE